jgi:hypothetical protein
MKKITKNRIRNCIFIGILLAMVGLGLYTGLNSDGRNGYWEGRALGGSIGIMGLLLYLIGVAAVKTYKKNKSISEVGSTFKKGFLEIISIDFGKAGRKKKKLRR